MQYNIRSVPNNVLRRMQSNFHLRRLSVLSRIRFRQVLPFNNTRIDIIIYSVIIYLGNIFRHQDTLMNLCNTISFARGTVGTANFHCNNRQPTWRTCSLDGHKVSMSTLLFTTTKNIDVLNSTLHLN